MTNQNQENADCLLKEEERTRCEVWTRVMGYHRPVSHFNAGKRMEHMQRKYFVERPGDLQLSRGLDNA